MPINTLITKLMNNLYNKHFYNTKTCITPNNSISL